MCFFCLFCLDIIRKLDHITLRVIAMTLQIFVLPTDNFVV